MKTLKMNITDEELKIIEELQSSLKLSTKTGTIGYALKLANLIATELKNGREVAFLNKSGRPVDRLVLPGIHD